MSDASPDSRPYRDGQVWMTAPRRRLVWFMEAPGRLRPILLFGLINLIPIAGQIAALGWMLETRDNLREGRTIVPPAGFAYLRRGLRPWFATVLVTWVWLAVVVVSGATAAVVVGAAAAWRSRLLLLVVPLGFLVALLLFGGLLLLGYTWAALVTVADARGVAAALDPVMLLEVAGANQSASWKTLGVSLVTLLIVLGCAIVPPAALVTSAVPYLMVAPWLTEVHLAPPGRR